jgi:hypothetical protein
MSELNVFATTYNLNTRGSSLTPTHLQHWLRPAFSSENASPSPDLVVIGVQELIPLYESCKLVLRDYTFRRSEFPSSQCQALELRS